VKLYLVRHAIAHERNPKKWPDDGLRPLTRRGTRRFEQTARGLRRAPPAAVYTSPLVRAVQTAEILARCARWPAHEVLHELEPHCPPAELLHALSALTPPQTAALVGHEPMLGKLAAFLLAGPQGKPLFEFKKGGVACLESENGLRPGAFRLLWLATPRLLRR
jgi:phosphohistidine phosphatase